jgi:iron complex outermembrane receptor protein
MTSAYAHDVYKLSGQADVEADLQASHIEYAIANDKYTGYNFSYGYFFLNPRLGINYNWNERWNSYYSMAYTSREPVLNDLYPGEESYYGETPQFKADTINGKIVYDYNSPYAQPEHLFDFELGSTYRWGASMFSGNVYWMEFVDELVENGQLNIFGEPVTSNAGRSRHVGIELEGAIPLNDEFALGGNFSASVNKLIQYNVNVNGANVSYNGNPIAGFPDALGNLRLTYMHHTLSVSVAGQYVGPFYTDNSHSDSLKVDAHFIANGEVVYHTPEIFGINFLIRGEVRNIFDALYFAAGDGNEFFPAAERNFIIGIVTNL